MVTSDLVTMRMVCRALATASRYTMMVRSKWGKYTQEMERVVREAHCIILMALRSNMIFGSTYFTDGTEEQYES